MLSCCVDRLLMLPRRHVLLARCCCAHDSLVVLGAPPGAAEEQLGVRLPCLVLGCAWLQALLLGWGQFCVLTVRARQQRQILKLRHCRVFSLTAR